MCSAAVAEMWQNCSEQDPHETGGLVVRDENL
jgi:hypothetical protein